MAVAFLPMYINYLGAEAYGLVGLFAIVQAAVIFLDMGMSPTLNREMSRLMSGQVNARDIDRLLRIFEVICIVVVVLTVGVSWFWAHDLALGWLKAEEIPPSMVAEALVLMTLVAALRMCEGIYRSSLYGLEQQVWYNVAYAASSTARYPGALIMLAWISPTIRTFFLWQAGVSIITILVLATRVHSVIPKGGVISGSAVYPLTDVWKFAGGMTGIALLSMLFLQLDKFILSGQVPLSELGYYTLAATAANVTFMVAVPVTQAVYPKLVQLASEPDQYQLLATYHGATQILAVMAASISLVVCVFSGGVVYVWSGSQQLVESAAPLMAILVIGSLLNVLAYLPHQLQIAHGNTGLVIKVDVLLIVLFLPAMALLVPTLGVKGAAWGWLFINGAKFLILGHVTHQEMLQGHQRKWLIDDILKPVMGALLVVIIAKLFEPQTQSSRLHWFGFLLTTGSLASISAAGVVPGLFQMVLSRIGRR